MPQPTPYEREFSFTQHSTTSPTTPQPGTKLDAEFDALELTTNETRANLAKIQRDDGKLANASVAWEQLSASVRGNLAALTAQELLAGEGVNIQVAPILAATGNGTTTAFTLPVAVATAAELLVSVSGVMQHTGAYFVTGSTLTLSTPPANNAPICVWLFANGQPMVATFTGNGVLTSFALPFNIASPGFVFATISGVVQHANAYTATGNQISFSSAPPNGHSIEIRQFVIVTLTPALLAALSQPGACCPASC